MKTLRTSGIILLIISTFFTACKKDKNNNTTPPDHCVTNTGLKNGDIIPGQYIVAYEPGNINRSADETDQQRISSDVLQRNSIAPHKLKAVLGGEPGGFVATLTEQEATRLQNDPLIQIVEPDRFIALSHCFTVVAAHLVTWNVRRVGYADGMGKTAWVIDTGIDMDHPDLNVDATRSRSFLGGDPSPDDANGHGTHVAGIIGALNNSFGVLGVASGANLVSLRVLNASGEGNLSSIIQALGYINTNASAGDVVNMSLGADSTSNILNQYVQNTANRGILIAIAAGNDADWANKYSPANTNGPNIFTISAIDSLNRFASFSNYGNDVVDYAAPGVHVVSTYSNGRYARLSGTSMAAPHVAGLLLLRGRNLTISGYAINDPDGIPDPIPRY